MDRLICVTLLIIHMKLHYSWQSDLCHFSCAACRCAYLPVVQGWVGSTLPLILLLLVSSSPDSSDSPLRSTTVSRQRQVKLYFSIQTQSCCISDTFSWCICNVMERLGPAPPSLLRSQGMSCEASSRCLTVTNQRLLTNVRSCVYTLRKHVCPPGITSYNY